MSESDYELTIPGGRYFPSGRPGVGHLRVTKDDARDIMEQCRKIVAEPEPVPAPWTPKQGDKVTIVKWNQEAEVLATWGQLAWLKAGNEAVCYGFEALSPIPSEPKKRVWRNGDFVMDTSIYEPAIYLGGKMFWLNSGVDSSYRPEHFDQYPILGNLQDIIAQGPVILGLNEGELRRARGAILIEADHPNDQLGHKLRAALTAYRANVKESKP